MITHILSSENPGAPFGWVVDFANGLNINNPLLV